MKATDRNLQDWFSLVGQGMVQLPRFQRFEAWGHKDVEALLETVLDGLPAGAALTLQVAGEPQFKHRPLVGAPEGTHQPTELLLDGQQRLTALYRSLIDDYPDRTFFLSLTTQNDNGGWDIVSQRRYHRNGSLYPMWADDPSQVLARGLVPLRLLSPGTEADKALRPWLEAATEGDSERLWDLHERITTLRVSLKTYNLPYLYLDRGTDRSIVLDVFVKMNTRLVKLTAFDIIVAEVEGDTGESLHDLVAGLNGQVPGLARYVDPHDLVLDAAALMQDRIPNRTGYFGVQWSEMLERWDRLVEGASRAVDFLQDEGIPDEARVPTRPALASLVALWADAPTKPDELGNVRTLLRSFLWRAFFTDRYERAAATASLQDFRALRDIVRTGDLGLSAPILESDLPDVDELMDVGWPRRRDRLARAVLLLSFRGGALDFADGAPINHVNITSREYHHLFPKAYLASIGVDEDGANNALNCALVTWRTNRTISASEPVKYLLERAEAATLGDAELQHRLRSHAIPFEPFVANDYSSFLESRAEVLSEAISQLATGVDWRPQ